MTAWHQGDKLVLAVAAQNNNTIVVVNSVGPLIIEPWADHPNVTAVSPPPPIITFTSNSGLDRVGKPWGERSRKCDRGYIVWSLESFWASSIHDCEECERLPSTTCSRGYGDGHPVHQLYRRVGFFLLYFFDLYDDTHGCRLFIDYRWFDAVSGISVFFTGMLTRHAAQHYSTLRIRIRSELYHVRVLQPGHHAYL